MQRQKRILYQRLRVPPAINQRTYGDYYKNTHQKPKRIRLLDLETLLMTRP